MEMILILGFGALLIFFMMNSRKKQRQQQEKLSTGLVPGARVMTSFGVFGTVVEVLPEENKVVIESGPGTVLTVHRQAIGTIEQPVAETPLDDELGGTEVPDDLSSLTPVDEDRAGTTEARSSDATEDVADDTAVEDDAVATADDDLADADATDRTVSDEAQDEAADTSVDTDDDSDDETRQNRG